MPAIVATITVKKCNVPDQRELVVVIHHQANMPFPVKIGQVEFRSFLTPKLGVEYLAHGTGPVYLRGETGFNSCVVRLAKDTALSVAACLRQDLQRLNEHFDGVY